MENFVEKDLLIPSSIDRNQLIVYYQKIDESILQKRDWTLQFESYIESNLTNPNLSLKRASVELGINEKTIAKFLKESYLLSFKQYLNNLRLSKAKDLINKQELSFKEISDLCGYTSANHFTRVFKLYCNQTPSEYKASLYIK